MRYLGVLLEKIGEEEEKKERREFLKKINVMILLDLSS